MKIFLTCLFSSFLLPGCGTLKPRDFANSTTQFEPDEYFNGHVSSWGVAENRNGEPRHRFTTKSTGTRDFTGDTLITQIFTHDDGSTQERRWKVHRIDPHHFKATANDVVGFAHGEAYGNAFRWEYTIALKPGNPFSHVHLKQWMYLPEGTETLFTRATVTKFGITVGEITESFQRTP